MPGLLSSNIGVVLPVTHIIDSNDVGEVYLNLTGGYAAFESDLIAYIKTKIAAVSGAGTISAWKATTVNTSV